MKAFILVAVLALLSGCVPDDQLSKLKPPVVVCAKGKSRISNNSSILLRSADGKYVAFYTDQFVGMALYDTYSVGDTVR